jgi:hypothetical protein
VQPLEEKQVIRIKLLRPPSSSFMETVILVSEEDLQMVMSHGRLDLENWQPIWELKDILKQSYILQLGDLLTLIRPLTITTLKSMFYK